MHMSLPQDPADLERHRAALLSHCYRMTGSLADAEDAVQDALLKGWRALPSFEGRSSIKTWLIRIATRVCLDQLEARRRERRRLVTPGPLDPAYGPPTPRADLDTVALIQDPASAFIEPLPDRALDLDALAPEARLVQREGVRLAYIAALQRLAPRQRAALLMAEVLDMSAADIAETLGTTVAATNSALQRARETLSRDPDAGPGRPFDPALVDRFMRAFEAYDVEALKRLLRDDARMSMPPFRLWLEGPDAIASWLLGRGSGCRGSRLIPTRANGAPAFGQYRPGPSPTEPHVPWALVVLGADDRGDSLVSMTYFLDTATLFPAFGLPSSLTPTVPDTGLGTA